MGLFSASQYFPKRNGQNCIVLKHNFSSSKPIFTKKLNSFQTKIKLFSNKNGTIFKQKWNYFQTKMELFSNKNIMLTMMDTLRLLV